MVTPLRKNKEDRIHSEVMITALGNDLVYGKSLTSDDGSFSFSDLTYMDSVTYIIQARKGDKVSTEDGVVGVEGNRSLDIHASIEKDIGQVEAQSEFITNDLISHYSPEDLDRLRYTFLEMQRRDSSLWVLDAPEVEIRSSRPYTTNLPIKGTFIMMDNADWCGPGNQWYWYV